MKLLNVSAGKIQTVEIGGEKVRTAHVKMPRPEPWIITPDGAEGDERASHPDKLYAFARTGYGHWQAQLGVAPGEWNDGFFGENLTFDGLDETDIRVGDEFMLGEDVRLFVSGARTPCIKLAWRLNQPRDFLKTFAASRHTGVYLGVLDPGTVKPGDRLERVVHDPGMPSIADVCDYVAGVQAPVELMRRLLAFERLSPTLRILLGARLNAAEAAERAGRHHWTGWRDFRIGRIVEETPEIRSVSLSPLDEGPLCLPQPGQFVSVRMADPSGDMIQRVWSLSSYAAGMDSYRLSIRRQQGPGSNWIHRAQAGDTVQLKAPAGSFVLDPGSYHPVVLVAAGIGITPLMAMLEAHLARENAPAPVHLIYGARRPGDAAFLGELLALAAARDDFTLTQVYSQADAGDWPRSRITAGIVKESVRDTYIALDGRRIPVPWYESDIYLCGPGDFCDALRDELVELGGQPGHIFSERFEAAGMAPGEIEEAEVRFVRSGTAAHWSARSGETLLDLAERAGVAVSSDCRAGACLTCRTPVTGGKVTADLGDGSALLCIGRPATPIIELDC
ncbi:MOSC domain-containing protein [Novosphingobium album (ex Hu et al. 2023)]|uniref:MOSC domain-containing protein n=1 Tax=Novosphingobium album (ex Hu et al. 2023) TaxID=2930093 RepID=A0ABT0B7G7_9SPHN|nr:MOSC domain-containing protein [Novosphingobium album (ex Hu et al. 2023)]MCJ2180958.1 MOSC domain-containing protein [Novosphingobium album (ex Hu et al. 2023)]